MSLLSRIAIRQAYGKSERFAETGFPRISLHRFHTLQSFQLTIFGLVEDARYNAAFHSIGVDHKQ
ncbi:hypothetical protein D3C76_1589570 [compost metagenome]